MLNDDQIHQNQEIFKQLLRSTKDINQDDISRLINYLEMSDFFTAPASTQYHGSYKGGLCEHSLRVAEVMTKLAKEFTPEKYSRDVLIIVGLFHDLSKVNFYEKYIMNKKVYADKGTKHDEMGAYDWKAIESYKVKDPENRYLVGNSGFTSYMILSRFIPLTDEEIVTLCQYQCDIDNQGHTRDITSMMSKYSLLDLLHCADIIATYIISKDE